MRDIRFRRLLIVGSRKDVEEGNYHSKVDPKSVLNSLKAWEVRYLIPVVWVGTPEEAAKKVESWLYWCARNIAEKANSLFRGCRDGLDD
jgi:DNA excision repair protein ERCC-4